MDAMINTSGRYRLMNVVVFVDDKLFGRYVPTTSTFYAASGTGPNKNKVSLNGTKYFGAPRFADSEDP